MSLTSSRLKHVYAQQKDLLMTDLLGNQSHVGELFSGNQFLTHLSAAPAVLSSPCVNSFLRPSHGLVDASMSRREAEPKDRIILFL
ncbi:hypothetical protein KP509_19G022000 [Ceratopteris richardii]|nr:hypothetical protein KP509_19G022000 [Ceratopteris richardii]